MTGILILGKDGQVGHELCASLAGMGPIDALGRAELDLADHAAIRATLGRLRPGLVINAAAFTAVDEAEKNPRLAMVVNRDAPRVLGEELKRLGGALIHYSTDYVFDGAKSSPYGEADAPDPVNVYGASKLAGERAIAATGVAHMILRLSGVYSDRRGNFVATIRERARGGGELKVVNDQAGSPTWARTIAAATRLIIERSRGALDACQGVYHLAAAGAATRYALATRVIELLARGRADAVRVTLMGISSAQLPAAAPRPRYSALSSTKLERQFGIELPAWNADLERFFQESAGS